MKYVKFILLGGILTLLLFAAYKAGGKVYEYKGESDLMIASLYESRAMGNRTVTLDTTALRVLCIGNSITHHAPRKGDLPGADSLWRGDWGMCASKEKMDYMHQLEKMFRQHNKNTTFTCKNIWVWENDFGINKDSLFGSVCQGKDLIILKIGENVKKDRAKQFGQAFDELVTYCLRFTPNVIIAGSYWKAPVKEQAMIRAAREHRLPYVPLFWIYETYRDEVIAHVGDTIYDRHGQPYPIPTEFICTHPNDRGMRMIAEAIFDSVEFIN